jgi:quercetin dioxygenase-like cupin family protein
MTKREAAAVLALVALLGASIASAQADTETMVIVKADDLVWKDYPGLPGVRFAVVSGDPKKEGPYTIRVKFAPGVMSRPHYHPEARYVTVLKGTWWAGTGDKFDRDATVPVPAGSFAMHNPRKVHYDGAKDEEVLVQISGIGPSGTIPVNPGESPK